ncbi:MAG: DUF885 domain-containing protein [Longimicrobiaceae bacterium]
MTLRPSAAALLLLLAVPAWARALAPAARAADSLAARVTALADEYVREFVARFPEEAEGNGMTIARHDGLTDNSLAARREWEARQDAWAAELARIDGGALWGRPEWVTHGMLREQLEAARGRRVCRRELWPVSHMNGWHANLAELAGTQPVGTPELRAQALARWRRVPRFLDTEVANLREGVRLGYTTPRRNVELVIGQLDALLATPAEESPFFDPARRDSAPEFRAAWRALLEREVAPAVRRYRDYLRDEYRGAAREAVGVSANRDGAACYRASFRGFTTLDRAPEETAALGRARVERNLAEAREVARAAYGTDDVLAVLDRIRADSARRFRGRDDLMAFAQGAVERAAAAAPGWFRTVPRARVEIVPHPAFLERSASDQYAPAAEDGSRPATYRINLYEPERKSRANAEITAFHETYPGHHLQISAAQELPGAHDVTGLVSSGAFVEGWARYAEALAEEMGLYTDPAARVTRRIWPARGMVVDPGIHVMGWTREQAVRYLMETGRGRESAETMVDRIAVLPGQLTAYDTGGLEFFALRERAERELGPAFDVRDFHDAVLGHGTITLPMLREAVDRWIASKKR